MSTIDPYPPDLLELPGNEVPDSDEALAKAINRLAQAVEQLTLTTIDSLTGGRSAPVAAAGAPPLAALPPVNPMSDATFDGCPTHHQPWKVVPAGVSKKTGRAYDAFKACPVAGCDQRPRL